MNDAEYIHLCNAIIATIMAIIDVTKERIVRRLSAIYFIS